MLALIKMLTAQINKENKGRKGGRSGDYPTNKPRSGGDYQYYQYDYEMPQDTQELVSRGEKEEEKEKGYELLSRSNSDNSACLTWVLQFTKEHGLKVNPMPSSSF